MMKIRYQNGQAVEAVTLSRTEKSMRVVVPGSDDVLDLSRVGGTWITEDCEPVSIEYPSRRAPGATIREEDCICPADLAAHLIHLLLNDSSEDVDADAVPAPECKTMAAARIA